MHKRGIKHHHLISLRGYTQYLPPEKYATSKGGGGDTPHLGYGILGGKKSGIWDMRAKKSGIWDMGKSSGIWDIGVEIINF